MARSFSINDGYKVEDLLQTADDHLYSAQKLYSIDVKTLDSAAYLSHLGIDLVLKAILLGVIGEFPDKHDLSKPYNMVQENVNGFELDHSSLSILESLNKQYQLRYPAPRPSKSPGVTGAGKEAVEILYQNIKDKMPSKILASYENINPNVKSGRIVLKK